MSVGICVVLFAEPMYIGLFAPYQALSSPALVKEKR